MNNTHDVLVVGAGMAGLLAALTAAQRGRSVAIITEGVGSLAISGGCMDVLGYVHGAPVADPWQAMEILPEDHPYRLVGTENVRAAFAAMTALTAEAGLPCTPPADGKNRRVPTIMGTLKPTWLCPSSGHGEALAAAARVLVLGVEGFKDCHPAVVSKQLQQYPEMAGKTFATATLAMPDSHRHRTLSPLDVARFLDTQAGRSWMSRQLAPHAGRYDVALLPPICGTRADTAAWQALCAALGCPVLEMLSMPPGVGGLRLRDVLHKALRAHGVTVVENATVTRAEQVGTRCTALITTAPDAERRYAADQFIIATGGILSGGIVTAPGKATERIFGLPVPLPVDVEQWTQPDIFVEHAVTRAGVRVNAQLQPVDGAGAPLLENVRFAGRTLGGYDFGLEKSGFGVAIATAWTAGRLV